ncbi:polyamine aminopropyltransferase [Candidatus Arthromitus sp. SFB-rat-Yit]|uniref:polyamine aminopropyltransferase n=1 Tax=Candidatus Arthromitus sp. SFB-rat-Yit TaxID=1041504 RepID=UPI000227A059|nr:polyamine aminopropyltransferase [Candidatus Arthromitus sp. SFB-rat-Yit]BAK80733.1 spermidine synthase [Candidatus Arthromitus sp. SFB-rat-Yit]
MNWFTEKYDDDVKISYRADKHLCHKKSKFQTIDVYNNNLFGNYLVIDDIMMITEKDEFIYHEMIVHTPMASNPNIKDVLVIGGGDGGTVRELCRYKNINSITMVEIDEEVVNVSLELFPNVSCSLKGNSKVKLLFEDGIEFVKNSPDKSYDLIIVDSTDPIGPGEGLFSLEFYSNCYRILRDDGILVNQSESPYYPFNIKELKRSASKINKIFPILKYYQSFIPTYPSGHWLFGFASKSINPINDNIPKWNLNNIKTNYYNTELHKASFVLPNYVRDIINEGKNK